jgi:ribosomal protein S2
MLFMPQRNEIKIFEKEQAVEKINQAVEAVNDYILQQEKISWI